MENEIINNEEVMDTAVEVVKDDSGNVIKVLGIAGISVLAGALAYKYVIKPIFLKKKTKKEESNGFIEVISEDDVEVEN